MQMTKMISGVMSTLIDLMERSPDKRITFHDFMAVCLYDPEHGYYNTDRIKIGKEGDFYTSSSLGSFMGKMLAKTFVRLLREEGWDQGNWQIVEWGGGTGRLSLHILDHLQVIEPSLYEKLQYTIVDRSSFHRSLQQEALLLHPQVRFQEPEQWLAHHQSVPTIVCSNELLDAFPVHRIRYYQGRFQQIYVSWDSKREQFQEQYDERLEPELLNFIEQEQLPTRERQHFEINLEADRWIRKMAERLNPGALVTIDYGDVREELYGPHRMNGTLMCYKKHQAHDNPYINVGEQDITAHVNFSSCIHSGIQAGLQNWELETQRRFLVSNGILELLVSHDGTDPFGAAARNNRAIRQLLLSDQMSELFKVLIQRK
jgi:SAM-dependent MidA family methyltransferase